MIFSAPVQHWLTGFHGYKARTSLDMPQLSSDPATLRLILPTLTGCASRCPGNLMLAIKLMREQSARLRLVLMPVRPDTDLTPVAQKLTRETNIKVDRLNDAFLDSRTRLAKYEQIQTSPEHPPQHAGYLYLYHPSSQILLTYTAPSLAAILSDIDTLNRGANDGDKHIQLVSN